MRRWLALATILFVGSLGCTKRVIPIKTTNASITSSKTTYAAGSPEDALRSFFDTLRYTDDEGMKKLLAQDVVPRLAERSVETVAKSLSLTMNEMQRRMDWRTVGEEGNKATVFVAPGYQAACALEGDLWKIRAIFQGTTPVFP